MALTIPETIPDEMRARALTAAGHGREEVQAQAWLDAFGGADERTRGRLLAVHEQRAQFAALAATRAAAAALPPSAADILAAEEEALAKEAAREAGEKAWTDALAKYGKGRVGRIATVDGLVVMRVATGAENDTNVNRIGSAPEGMRTAIAKECTLDGVVYPTRDRAREICERWPGVWLKMYELRDALMSGEESALTGKA